MLRSVRKKVASSISKVDPVEDFHFNSWLRALPSEQYPIGIIKTSVKNAFDIKYSIDFPITDEVVFELTDAQILPELKYYYFEKIKSHTVFFVMHNVPTHGADLSEIQPVPMGYVAQNVKFSFTEKPVTEVQVRFNLPTPKDQNFRLTTPEVTDYLAAMVPQIINIELLKIEELEKTYKEAKVISIDLADIKKTKSKKIPLPVIKKANKIYKVKVPGIGKIQSTVKNINITDFGKPGIFETAHLSMPPAQTFLGDFGISATEPYKYYDSSDEESVSDVILKEKDLINPGEVKDILKLILKNVTKVDWDKRKDADFKLLKYEEEGAKFLVENESALLIDEFGIDKQRETIAALKFLFGNRAIKSVLLLSLPGKEGSVTIGNSSKLESGWLGVLNKYCPELSVSNIKGDDDERADAWNRSALVYVANHKTAVNDFHFKILEKKKLNTFDCIILDEAHFVNSQNEKEKEFIQSLEPSVFWALSSLVDKNLKDDLNSILNKNKRIESVLVRTQEKISASGTRFIWNENWLSLTEEQSVRYKETLVDCQKELRRVLESGNPYRFQANIFTLLHKLKQICNFAPGQLMSPKTDLLFEQVNAIKYSNKKVIIFSQYDRLGTRKIERFLSEKGINTILAPGSLSLDDMNKSISLFRDKKDVTAFITDAKIAKLKFANFNVPYIIKFDHWWNPLNLWELQDLFDQNESSENNGVSIYSYYVQNTIDEEIKILLTEKGFYEKNILEMMPNKVFDELVSVDEWLRLFKLNTINPEDQPNPGSLLKALLNSNLSYYRTLLSKLFYKIGYAKIDIIDEPGSTSFNIVGEANRNTSNAYLFCRVVLEDIVSKKEVSDVMFQAGSTPGNKVFVITKGSFEDGCESLVTDNVTLLDGFHLSRFILNFNLHESQSGGSGNLWPEHNF